MSASAVCGWCFGDHGESECPYSAEEARAVRKARKARQAAREGRDRRPLETAASGLRIPGSSKTIFRNGRAFRPGRPRVPVPEQRQKARARVRAYRQRRRAKGGAA